MTLSEAKHGLIFVFIVLYTGKLEVNTEEIQHEKVVIIGAGISGFGAASRLLENNISNFKILEAEDRIGGRINSVHLGEGFIDLGAEYIHGEQGNIIYELSKGYIKLPQNVRPPDLYYSNGEKLQDSFMTDFFEQLTEFEMTPGPPNISVSEAFLIRYNSSILPKYRSDSKTLRIAEEFIRTIEQILLSIEGSFDWYVPRSKFHNLEVYPGNPIQTWSGMGYKTIFDVLRKKIGKENSEKLDSRINFKKSVTNITRGYNKSIYVECQDGSRLTADHVIFTASLGVLKHDHKKIFHPELDELHINAIESLGIGAIMKVGLEFSESWLTNAPDTYLVWSEEDKKKLFQDVTFGPSKGAEHWLSSVFSIALYPNNPKVVVVWISGHLVPEIEQLNDEQLKKGITYVLKKFFGREHTIKEPISIVHSKWCTNPHFRGSFSFEPLGVSYLKNSPHRDFLKPVSDETDTPRILFAGEATHPNRFSTADGALASGFIQADKLLEFWKRKV